MVYLRTAELLRRKGHQVVHFSKCSPLNMPCDEGAYFVKEIDYFRHASSLASLALACRFVYSREARVKVEELLSHTHPDVAHIHLLKGDITCSILPVLRRAGVPIVLTVHDFGLICPRNLLLDSDGEICDRCIRRSAWQCLFRRCNRKSVPLSAVSTAEFLVQRYLFPPEKYYDRIIAVSGFTLERHRSRKRLLGKMVHVFNFYPGLKASRPVPEKGDYMLYCGRISREKGLKTLLQAWRAIQGEMRLKVVGSGPLEDELRQYARQNRIGSVEFLGYQSGEALNELIRNAAFSILPSECYENNPLSIIEAYAWGKPVIAANVGGVPEIVEHGRTGFLYRARSVPDLASTLKRAITVSLAEYRDMSLRARAFAEENFSEENHYSRLMEIYEDAIRLRALEEQ